LKKKKRVLFIYAEFNYCYCYLLLLLLQVYDVVCQALDSIGAVYKPSVIGLAASGARGGASALIMSMKTALESRDKNGSHNKTQLNSTITTPSSYKSNNSGGSGSQQQQQAPFLGTVRSTKEPFTRIPVTDEGQDDFLQRTIKEHPAAFDTTIKGRNPFTEVDMVSESSFLFLFIHEKFSLPHTEIFHFAICVFIHLLLMKMITIITIKIKINTQLCFSKGGPFAKVS
jgi:hypothetical protein